MWPDVGYKSAHVGPRGPTSRLGSDPSSTLRQTHDLIDVKMPKLTKIVVFLPVQTVRVSIEFQYLLKSIISHPNL